MNASTMVGECMRTRESCTPEVSCCFWCRGDAHQRCRICLSAVRAEAVLVLYLDAGPDARSVPHPVSDSPALSCQREIKWEQVWEKAERLGWEEVVRLTLSACHALFAMPRPAQFPLRELPPWLQLFPHDPSPRPWQHTFFPLYLLKRPSDRHRCGLGVLLVPTLAERQCLRLPCLPLYYPLRPLRLGCQWDWWLVLAGLQRLRIAGNS